MCTPAKTKLAEKLNAVGLNRSSLARKLGVKRQSAAAWVNGTEACPGRRQAQIIVLIDARAPRPLGLLRCRDYFYEDGYAIPTGRQDGRPGTCT